MKPIIKVSGLSKSYSISHHLKPEYSTLKDSFDDFIKKPFRKNKKESHETFWALNDVSFEVKKGEIFGVVGRNGSGKSTLLKILSRTVQPTRGEITMHGRTASLLEVGTGFHPELTGRENIFFNGSMLGMSRKEILKKFDEIVAFSEVEKFIDTPVKFYSSGMYVRLAFSVAAHLKPDILILDEVLAVGDANFQKKSLNKIKETMQQGTTVIFVSHSMSAVQQLCSRGLILNGGKIEFIGNIDEVADRYNSMMKSLEPTKPVKSIWENAGEVENQYITPTSMYITDDDGNHINNATPNNTDKWLHLELDVKESRTDYTVGYALKTDSKSLLYMSFATDDNPKLANLNKGKVTLKTKIPAHLINEGHYQISFLAGAYNKFWIFDPDEQTPSIELIIEGGLSDSKYWQAARSGLLAPNIEWRTK